MTLDSEKQRQILLQLIEAAMIPGKMLEQVAALRRAIIDATINDLGD